MFKKAKLLLLVFFTFQNTSSSRQINDSLTLKILHLFKNSSLDYVKLFFLNKGLEASTEATGAQGLYPITSNLCSTINLKSLIESIHEQENKDYLTFEESKTLNKDKKKLKKSYQILLKLNQSEKNFHRIAIYDFNPISIVGRFARFYNKLFVYRKKRYS